MAKKKVRKPAKRPVKKLAKKTVKTKTASRKAQKKLRVKAKKHVTKKPETKAESTRIHIGNVTHYFTNIKVGIIELLKPLKVGDIISVEGTTTNFKQKASSMQINKKPVLEAKKGDIIGLEMNKRVREKDKIYLVR